MNKFISFLKSFVFVALALGGTYLISIFLSGILVGLGGNIEIAGLNKISFDPLITIAYIILYYFLSHFYELSERPMYWMFLLTLYFSFSVNFIQGTIILVILPPLLKKLKLISSPDPLE